MTQSYYPSSKKQQAPSPGVMEKPTGRIGSYSTPQLPPPPCCQPRHLWRRPSSSEMTTKLRFFLADISMSAVNCPETEQKNKAAHEALLIFGVPLADSAVTQSCSSKAPP